MTRQTKASLRRRSGHGPLGKMGRNLKQVVRRLRVKATNEVLWVLGGFIDGEGNEEPEVAETFDGVGFYSRPKDDSNTEAVVLKVGAESGHPVIVATRDRALLDALIAAEGMAQDETAIFTSKSVVKILADGSIEIKSIGGSSEPLATKSDLDKLADHVDSHFHSTTATIGAGAVPGVISAPTVGSPAAAGTQKLKGE